MNRIETHWKLLTANGALLLVLGGCGEPECPQGYYKDHKLCRRVDASVATNDSAVAVDLDDGGAVGAVVVEADAAPLRDASSPSLDAQGGQPEAGPSIPAIGGGSPTEADAQTDSGTNDATTPSPGECDTSRPCSAGYACVDAKCVSECERTKCDVNASCALKGGTPTCSCNNGFVAQGTGNAMTCARDLACDQLGCHANAGCEKGTDQLLHCVCKPGYGGNGTNCAPVMCDPLTIENGTVTGGTSYNDTATYRCNSGYELNLLVGNWTRKCGADKQWTGTPAQCKPVYCGAPASVTHATVVPASAAPFNSKATYTCDTGYEPSGSTSVTCGANMEWSSPPKCTPKCGNGRLDSGEECDLSAPSTSQWTCSIACRRSTIYTLCWSNDECVSGEQCDGFYRVCTRSCGSDASCPVTASGTNTVRWCNATLGSQCSAGCDSNSQCPAGLVCTAAGEGSTVPGACVGCYFSEQCGAGKLCVDQAGNPRSGNGMGRCQ
jgi:hypothetical protein